MKSFKVLFILLLPIISFGQKQSDESFCKHYIKGIVVDSNSHAALPFASIYVSSLQRGTTSDEFGNFRVDKLCDGKYEVFITSIGYKPTTFTLIINENIRKEFALVKDNIQLEEVTVEGKVEKTEILQKTKIEGRALDNMRGKSLAGSLQTLPGVNMIQTGPSISKPVIHGMHSNRVLILNNGVRLEGQQWGSEHAPEIDPFVASELSVLSGAASVRYGSDAIGGVIMVQPKKLPYDSSLKGEVNMVGISNGRQGIASGIIEGSVNKIMGFAYRLQGTYKIAGNISTPDYYLKNTGAKELNFSSAVGYRLKNFNTEVFFSRFNTKLGIYTGSHLISIPSATAAINSDKPLVESDFSYKVDRPYQSVNHNLLKFTSSYYFETLGKVNFTYAFQYNSREEYDAHRPRNDSLASLKKPEVNFQLATQTAELSYDHKKWNNISGSIGLSGMKQINVFDPLTRRLIPNFRSYNGGVFIIERYVKDKLELEVGIRYDYRWIKTFDRKKSSSPVKTYLFEFHNLTATVGGIYHIDPHWTLRANIGSAWRPPSINEWFFYGRQHGEGRFIKGDTTLNSEVAYNINASASYKGHRLTLEITPYYNRIDNYIYQKAEIFYNEITQKEELRYEQTIAGAYPSFKYTQANAVFIGADFTINYNITKSLLLNSTTSILRVKDKDTKQYIENIPSDKFQNSLTYNFRDLGGLKKPAIAVTHIYVAKQTRVPDYPVFLPPPSSYSLLNGDLNFSFLIRKQVAEVGFTINNIANTRYRDYLNTFRYYADEMGRSFIFRLKVPFNL